MGQSLRELYRDTGVVLRTYRLRESDRIVVIMTEHHGKVRAVARGVRKTKSKFGSRLEPMSHTRLLLVRGRELDIVSQAESVESVAPLLSSLDRTSRAMAIIEAVDQLSIEREPDPQLYRMLVGALRSIADNPSPLTVAAFYLKVLAAAGVGPELQSCVRCSEQGPQVQLVAFDTSEGGVVCRSCRSGVAISSGAIELMRDVLGGRLSHALAQPESAITHEIGSIATRCLEHHVERRLRAVAMFEGH
jgi:DNA repair protein RecO (recombination protein O)